ncbi:protein of unknown function [Vibrio tapetis subsp. tapetis]|uniref:Uncharacterized protein n=1 Tax=Vibrio tapetis subsp. tapetis TaxID=1671868 RepID=A0A2N8ZN84_9VIBR|nr:protein of unknown function [Vibrio tapetis subsp. tapetis]
MCTAWLNWSTLILSSFDIESNAKMSEGGIGFPLMAHVIRNSASYPMTSFD